MFEYLFGTQVIEKILFYLIINERCYPSELKKIFNMPLYSFQRALSRLEKGGIVVSQRQGKTLMYQFNPRYPFIDEFKRLLQKAYSFLPEDIRETLYEPVVRRRPRRLGKPETLKALKESRESKLESYKTLDEFWKAMGIDPNV